MIEKFRLFGSLVWVPRELSDRASTSEECSEECPYNSVEIPIVDTVRTREKADKEVEYWDGIEYFCWEKCDIEDCPAYMANNS